VVALQGNGHIEGFDAVTGRSLWRTQVTGQGSYWSPPVAAGGIVYVIGLSWGISAVDEKTGATLWTSGAGGASDGPAAVSQGVVYETGGCEQLSAFDALTGALNWIYSTSCTGGGGATPSLFADRIWVRDDLGDVIISSSGHLAGTFSSAYAPAFHAGMAFYASRSEVDAVSLKTGATKWVFRGDGHLCTSAVVAGGGGQIFVGSDSGNVYEVDEQSGKQRSVSMAGNGLICGSEMQAMALAGGHLLVPVGNTLVVF
jgi:outer membrane protein assembly factor BamB